MTGFAAIALKVAAFVLGLAFGSFLNVVIFRLPREGLALDRPRRSFCPICAAPIGWRDNIPVLSWLLLKGRCRSCHSRVSWRYPLVELVAAFLSLFVFQVEGLTVRYFLTLYFLLCLTAVAFIDLEHLIIPDGLVIPTIVWGVILAVLDPLPYLVGDNYWFALLDMGWNPRLIGLVGAAFSFILGFGILFLTGFLYQRVRGRVGLGDGDPPLMGLIGVYLGWMAVFPVLFLSSVLALLSVGVLALTGRGTEEGPIALRPVPFGPFLALAALIWSFFGPAIFAWYFNLFA
ncbi:MAG: prepilin peptidase [Deltaproteobacteria bacterium]|jgi:leader peptidase (prepilin peptidase)/N-methyltransferase|nr:prepilin peptidase [Deltaproteobacteria bacterium]